MNNFVCSNCNNVFPKWHGQCPDCKEWGSIEESQAVNTKSAFNKGKKYVEIEPAKTSKLNKHTSAQYTRYSSGSGELDGVLGGGFVSGSLVLFTGSPGAGKSTLASSITNHIANDKNVLYVAGEESPQQIKLRIERMKLENADKIDITTDIEANSVSALFPNYDFVVIDSIQTLYDKNSSTASIGGVSMIKAVCQILMEHAKANSCTLLIIGHINKEGTVAGPKHLEHMVDAVLQLEGDNNSDYKIIRANKNRFGSTNEIGVFEMTSMGLKEILDPTTLFLQEHQDRVPGSVICPTLEGSRIVLVEIQALTAPVNFANAMPIRRVRGIDKNKLDMLIAILQRHAKLPLQLGSKDIYVNISGGIKVDEPACDLAICAAIASAAMEIPIKKSTAVFGEVSLLGEVRPINNPSKRVDESTKLGYSNLVGPIKQTKTSAKTLAQALYFTLDKGDKPQAPKAPKEKKEDEFDNMFKEKFANKENNDNKVESE